MNVIEMTSAAQSSRVINFDKAEVVGGFVNNSFFLVVSGEAPCINMEVSLIPLMYVRCPEYWGIEVVGTLPGGFCLDAVKPFTVTIALTGITGSQGIEVIGANSTKRFDVGGGCS